MKLHKSSSPGVALVIVLGFLVIISALAVAFFSSVTTELKASRNYAAGVTTRQSADSAVQTVMGQIHDATTRPGACWASQPGMIRVYRDGTDQAPVPSANPDAFFKLYSSDNMVVTKNQLSGFDALNFSQDLPTNWATSPAVFTDLNAPVMVVDPDQPQAGKIARYPIINPTAVGQIDGFSITNPPTGTTNPLPMPVKWIYVLLDGTFTAPNAGGTTSVQFGSNGPAPTQANPIVGRIAFWTDDETSKLNINTAAGFMPTAPLSGYSTANFAGSFWDTPRFYTAFDMGTPNATGMPISGGGGLAICQLLQNEFQRYPGHPATTSLNPVFGPMINSNNPLLTNDQLYKMVPRYTTLNMNSVAGSSAGGTVRIVTGTNIPNPTPDVFQLQPKQDRLFASVDELIYAPHATSLSTQPSYARQNNNSYLGVSTINSSLLDKVRFFLTTQSRAPELNLYGQPRISIWPVRYQASGEGSSISTNGLNAFDNTILFCSSVGQTTNTTPPNTESVPTTTSPIYPTSTGVFPYRYIFTRRELRSPGTNYSTDQLASTYGSTSYTGSGNVQDINLQRNRQLISYLQNLTGGSTTTASTVGDIPGFGGNFRGKYGENNRDAILTEIFDYIRCANAIDTTSMSTTAFTNGTPTGYPVINAGNPAQFAPQGIIMPSRVQLTGATVVGGMGRFPTVSEATLVFYYAGGKPDPAKAGHLLMAKDAVDTNPQGYYYPTHRRYRAFLLLSTFDPMQGYAPTANPTQYAPKIGFSVTGLNSPGSFTMQTWQDATANTPGSIKAPGLPIFLNTPQYTQTAQTWQTTLTAASGASWGGRNYGGYEGFMHTLIGQNTAWAPHKIARAYGNPPTGNSLLAYPYNAISQGPGANQPANAYTNQAFYELQSPDPDLFPAAEIAIPENITASKQNGKLVITDSSDGYFTISGGTVTVQVTYGGVKLQVLTLNFPATIPASATTRVAWPLPQGDPGANFQRDATGKTYDNSDPSAGANPGQPPYGWETSGYGGVTTNGNSANPAATTDLGNYYWPDTGSVYPSWHRTYTGAGTPPTNTVYQAHLASAWSLAGRIAWSMQRSDDPMYNSSSTALNYYASRWRNIVQPGDTIRSLVYCKTPAPVGATNSGDMRLALVQSNPTDYYPHPDYFTGYNRACLLRMADGNQYFPQGGWPQTNPPTKIGPNPAPWGNPTSWTAAQFWDTGLGNHVSIVGTAPIGSGPARFPGNVAFGNLPYSYYNGSNAVNGGVNGVWLYNSTAGSPLWGDFDTGIGSNADGPFGNKQDEGNVIYAYQDPQTLVWYYPIPYFAGTWQYAPPGNTYTSPCRQMPSPAMFGSLPSQPLTINSNGTTGQGWTTLCFCPNPAAGPGAAHPGNAAPKDHLLLDLFQMPVVEPYPISEPFSTAGKVNLNYKIAPFGYITRSTALRGVLTPMRVTAVPVTINAQASSWNDWYLCYKSGNPNGSGGQTYVNFE